MQVNQSGQESSQNYTETGNKGKYPLPNWEKIDNSPFGLVNNPEKGYFISLGINRLTDFYETANEALEQLEKDKWNMIFKLIIIVGDAAEIVGKEMEEEGIEKYMKDIRE